MAEPSDNPPDPPHAARSAAHYACRRRLPPLAGDKNDAPPACTVPFRPYCGDVITRTRNVSEYMLVLALCLVVLVVVDGSVESGDDRDLLSSKKDDGNLTHYFRARHRISGQYRHVPSGSRRVKGSHVQSG